MAHPSLLKALPLFIASLLFAFPPVEALTLMPMRLEQRRGQLQVINPGDRLQRVEIEVFLGTTASGKSSVEPIPLSASQAEALIRFRPSTVRLGPGATRFISYSIVGDAPSFFVCGTTLQGLVRARVCSRWLSGMGSSLKQP